MDASTRFGSQLVGAMPLIIALFDRLGFSQVIDEVVPYQGDVPLSELIEILVLNRLLNPKAMFRIGDWAESAAVTNYYGRTADELNDDRLGRALERIAEHGDAIQAGLVINAIKEFGLKVDQLHSDITTVELYGAYDNEKLNPGDGPQPKYGHSKSGRKNMKQLQQNLTVTNDGGVPVVCKPLDGNTAEAKTHIENMNKLRKQFPSQKLVYIADSKLDTDENLLNIVSHKGNFICGGAFNPKLKKQFLTLHNQLNKINYCSVSQQKRPKEKRDEYHGVEVKETMSGNVEGRGFVSMTYRLIFIWSERKARDTGKTRDRHLSKIREELDTVQRNLNKFSLKTEGKIIQRLEKAKAKYSAGKLFNYTLTKGKGGKFKLTYALDDDELQRLKKLDGVFVLKTNLPKRTHPLKKILINYREQNGVERRFGNEKGPLAVTPMFLKKPTRMAGLLYIIVWALMIMSLMERAIRKELDGEPIYGLYPENRPNLAPTAKAIMECFETLCLVIIKQPGQDIVRRLAELNTVQREIIKLLGIPPAHLRTFKKRCGM